MEGSQRHRRLPRVREAPAPRYSPDPQIREVAGVLLDSDVIIEILRGRRWAVDASGSLDREEIPAYCCAMKLERQEAGLG